MTPEPKPHAHAVGKEGEYAIKAGYGSGGFEIGRVTKESAKTLTVRERWFDLKERGHDSRWLVADVLARCATEEEAKARVRSATDAYKSHAANVRSAADEHQRAKSEQMEAALTALKSPLHITAAVTE